MNIVPGTLCLVLAPDEAAGKTCTALYFLRNARCYWESGQISRADVWIVDLPVSNPECDSRGVLPKCLRPLTPPPGTKIDADDERQDELAAVRDRVYAAWALAAERAIRIRQGREREKRAGSLWTPADEWRYREVLLSDAMAELMLRGAW